MNMDYTGLIGDLLAMYDRIIGSAEIMNKLNRQTALALADNIWLFRHELRCRGYE